jgi:carbamoyl-phosphate synthase large subunit
VPNAICQEFITGTEHTCDVYVDFNMKVRCVVPRKRIEVRAGEVSKGQVVKHHSIMSEAARLVETLGAGPGIITLQLFLTADNKVKFIEINPRNIRFNGFRDNLIMLRYDSEVWLKNP